MLCEKPLSRRAADAARAFDVAERCGRLLMEAFMYRHNPQTARLVELIAEGAIGRLRLVRASFGFYLDDETNVRMRGELEGGGLMDVGCYCVNAARLLCGEPLRAQAEQLLGGAGVDVALAGVLGFADEVLAHFDCGLVLSPRDELVVLGEQGSLHLADPWHCRTPGIELRRSGGSETIDDRGRGLLRARAREPLGGDPRNRRAAARPRGRARPGARDRGALRLGAASTGP